MNIFLSKQFYSALFRRFSEKGVVHIPYKSYICNKYNVKS